MKYAREDHSATLLPNGQVLVAGGADQFQALTSGTADTASAELFKGNGWSTTGSMNTVREGHSATLLPNGLVLVAGGFQSEPSGGQTLSSAELFNPATGTWTVTGSMNDARAGHRAILLPNGLVLVVGGFGSSAELYDPATGTWTLTGSMSVARDAHTATLLPNGQVLVAGGFGLTGTLSSAELYTPATGTWTVTGSLNIARYAHQAVLLSNGQPLVLDGISTASGGIVKLSSTELYDPATGTWTVNGGTIQSGANFSVTLLGTGKVLIAGGITGVYPHEHVTNAAELYDPSVGASVSTGSMKTARFDHSATLLTTGQVVVAGGLSTNQKGEYFVKSAELYTP
jgi:hypothetical protein